MTQGPATGGVGGGDGVSTDDDASSGALAAGDDIAPPDDLAPPDDPARARPASRRWEDLPGALRARGLRWTPQRRTLLEVLATTSGHVTGAELVDRCRAVDPGTIPSTVYRTLDVLEDLGIVRHAHGANGREEFHILPEAEHGHLYCLGCRETWEIGEREAAALVAALRTERGFTVELSHLSISGLCRHCGEG